MIFDQEKYYKYTKTLEKYVIAIYVISILISISIGQFYGFIGIIISGLIGFFIASIYTIMIKIKIQKMNWEIEIYNIIKKKEIT